MAHVETVGELHGLTIGYKGAYALTENSDASISVELFDLNDT
jgi:hypothetical protein